MLRSSVALVVQEPVARKGAIEIVHYVVAGNLGANRCTGYGDTASIAMDQGGLGDGRVGKRERVDEQMLHLRLESVERLAHGAPCRGDYSDGVEGRRGDRADS